MAYSWMSAQAAQAEDTRKAQRKATVAAERERLERIAAERDVAFRLVAMACGDGKTSADLLTAARKSSDMRRAIESICRRPLERCGARSLGLCLRGRLAGRRGAGHLTIWTAAASQV